MLERPHAGIVLLMVCAAASVTGALWVVDYLPTHDGPQHVFSGHLENSLDTLSEEMRGLVVEQPLLTSHGFRLLFVPLERACGWRTALRLTLSFWVVVWTLGFIRLILVADRQRLWLAVLAPGLALSWSLYLGFFNYLAATAVSFWIVAEVAHRPRLTPVPAAVLSAALTGQTMLHAFAGGLTGMALLIIVLVRTPRQRVVRETVLLALAGLPAATIALTVALIGSGDFGASGALRWLGPAGQLRLLLAVTAVGPVWRSLPCLLLAVTGVVLCLRSWPSRTATERGLSAVAAVLLLVGTAAPFEIPGWEGFSPRFVPLGVACGLALLPVERLSRGRRAAAAAALVLLATASLAWSYHFHLRLRHGCEPLMQALQADIRRHGFRFFVAFRSCLSEEVSDETPAVPGALFVQHFGALFATDQGGIPPSFQGSTAIHRFTLYTVPAAGLPRPRYLDWSRLISGLEHSPDAGEGSFRWFATSTQIAEHAARFEDIVVFGSAQERREIVTRGFVADLDQEEVFIGRFRGCPLQVVLPPGWGSSTPVLAEYGWWPLAAPSWQTSFRTTTGGQERLQLQKAPCGPVWLRLALDTDGSGTVSAADLLCQGADATGTIVLHGRGDEATWICHPAG